MKKLSRYEPESYQVLTPYSIRSLAKWFCPPVLVPLARSIQQIINRGDHPGLCGIYRSWEEAVKNSVGYSDPSILERVEKASLLVKNGRAAFERDSVTFEKRDLPYPLLAAVLRSAIIHDGPLVVLDFGGSLGSSYWLCRPFIPNQKPLRWFVVEQKHYVERGRALFETEELRFFNSIAEAASTQRPTIALLSSVLQYLEHPEEVLIDIRGFGVSSILIDRTPWSERPDDIFTVQVVPPQIFPARLPFRVFGAGKLAALLGNQYREVVCFQAIDPDMFLGTLRVRFSGWLYDRSQSTAEGERA